MKGLTFFIVASLIASGSLIFEYLHYASYAFHGWFWIAAGLFIAGYLLWTRRDKFTLRSIGNGPEQPRERVQGDPQAFALAMVIGLTSVLLAQLLHWPYLGWIAFLYLLGVAVYGEFGKPGVVAIRPVLILLIFLNPIPIPCESWHSLTLQGISTSMTMVMLDFLRIFFFSEGNVLGLISEQRLFPELFQGVSWLFPTIFIAIAWGVHYGYGWIRTTINVCQAIVWVIVGNAAVAALLLANKHEGGNWVDFPSAVALWDYIKFAAILCFTWSGDQFLASTLRSTQDESHDLNHRNSETVRLLPLRWRPTGLQYALAFGLLVVGGLSIRLSTYHRGMLPSQSITKGIELSNQIDSWNVERLDAEQHPVWVPAGSSVRSWSLQRDGRKMVFEIATSSNIPKSHLFSWLWTGWRLERPPDILDLGETGRSPMLAQLNRLPGEVCTVLALGTDQYGSLGSPQSPLELGFEMPSIAQRNLLKALGASPMKPEGETIKLPPSCTLFLSVVSSRPLDSAMLDELKQCWSAVIPSVARELTENGSR